MDGLISNQFNVQVQLENKSLNSSMEYTLPQKNIRLQNVNLNPQLKFKKSLIIETDDLDKNIEKIT